MRTITFIILLAASASTAFAQTAPTVSNVRASQRGDASLLVDIYYDLSHNTDCTVWTVLSGDGGQTWTLPMTSLSGAVGAGVTPSLSRHIVWDCKIDLPGAFGTQYKVQVCAVPVPVPGAACLGALGLGLVGFLRRRTKSAS
jgi:MYXO-CTERM domain-containing protein